MVDLRIIIQSRSKAVDTNMCGLIKCIHLLALLHMMLLSTCGGQKNVPLRANAQNVLEQWQCKSPQPRLVYLSTFCQFSLFLNFACFIWKFYENFITNSYCFRKIFNFHFFLFLINLSN